MNRDDCQTLEIGRGPVQRQNCGTFCHAAAKRRSLRIERELNGRGTRKLAKAASAVQQPRTGYRSDDGGK